MKKLMLMCCALALPVCMLFTACDKDKDEETKSLAQSVEGSYEVNISYTGVEPSPATVQVTAESENTIKVDLSGFMIGQATIPISLSGISVSGSEGDVSVSYDGPVEVAGMGSGSGKLSGTIKAGKMDLLFQIQLGISLDVTIQSR